MSGWNSYLADYIFHDLQKIVVWDSVCEFSYQTNWIKRLNKENSEENKINFFFWMRGDQSSYLSYLGNLLSPGKLLLEGLSRLSDYQFQIYKNGDSMCPLWAEQLLSAHTLLKAAINRGVTHANLLTKQVMEKDKSFNFKTVLIDLAMCSAAQKNYQALENFCLEIIAEGNGNYNPYLLQFLKELYTRYQQHYPPLLIFRAYCMIKARVFQNEEQNFQECVEKAESFFNQGIEGYKKDQSPILPEAWLIGAEIKRDLGKWAEADACMTEAMLVSRQYISYTTWKLRAEIKEGLGDVKEAVLSLDKIIDNCWDDAQVGDTCYRGDGYEESIEKEEMEAIEFKYKQLKARRNDTHHDAN